jgi:hypothetical protein
MVTVAPYSDAHKQVWDRFVAEAKNGVFLFYRDYLEYHRDRFADFSLLFFDGDKLLGILPANRDGDTLCSHGGLTFGGILSDQRMRTPVMLELFDAMREHLKAEGIAKILYKAVPHIYHDVPAEEDLYALFRHAARLVRRDVSSTIWMKDRVALSKGRKWSIKKGRASGLSVGRSYDFRTFMAIEEEVLQQRHGVKPTHTAEEIEALARRFPEHIQLYAATREGQMLAGAIVYESRSVAHTQYIASTDEGRKLFAGDLLLDVLINETYVQKKYFDFGISTESRGRILNVGLVTQKEEFGARATVYDTYEMDVR